MRHAEQWDSTAGLLASSLAPPGREAAWALATEFLNAGHRDDVHMVASVFVVDLDGLVLLARHRRYGQWGPLGGHLDPDDVSLLAGAARELLEEASLTAHVHPAPIDVLLAPYRCRSVEEPVFHLDVRFAAFVAASAPAVVANDELSGLEWCVPSRLPAPLTPDTAQLVGLATAVATSRP